MSIFNYRRRHSECVTIGNVVVGGDNPIRLQSMTNTSTNDIDASVEQTLQIAAAGGDIVRPTTQGIREAENIGLIRKELHRRSCFVPLVADVHFNPKAAYTAAANTDKVRINPGNFADAARTFRKIEFTDEEYNAEIDKIRNSLIPFLDLCKKHGTAIRLGVNHGSLSDRIMSRYGDTPAGMVESVMEYLRICREQMFEQIVISIKASNTIVMTQTVKMLIEAMDSEQMHYPLHLGVTEAGDGEDGRIKSAVGIGALLAQGIGDTIRVSLSEAPENEIPVAKMLVDYISMRKNHAPVCEPKTHIEPKRLPVAGYENTKYPVVGLDITSIADNWHIVNAGDNTDNITDNQPIVVSSTNANMPGDIISYAIRLAEQGKHNAIIPHIKYDTDSIEELQIQAGADFGTILLNGVGSAIYIEAPNIDTNIVNRIALGILQAAGLRISHTEYIACPGCGRTMFDLQTTLKEVKKATAHLKGLKIGVMGCIVNGPGEMADADYGYVGAAAGKVSLYKNKQCIEKNIPQEQAIDRLISFIKENGDWCDPE